MFHPSRTSFRKYIIGKDCLKRSFFQLNKIIRQLFFDKVRMKDFIHALAMNNKAALKSQIHTTTTREQR